MINRIENICPFLYIVDEDFNVVFLVIDESITSLNHVRVSLEKGFPVVIGICEGTRNLVQIIQKFVFEQNDQTRYAFGSTLGGLF